MLDRESILQRMATPKLQPVDVPEWGNNGSAILYVRPLTADEYERLMGQSQNGRMSEKEAAARLCVAGVCDKDGKRVFLDEDCHMLIQSPFGWSAVLRCAKAVAEINNMQGDAGPLGDSETTP